MEKELLDKLKHRKKRSLQRVEASTGILGVTQRDCTSSQ